MYPLVYDDAQELLGRYGIHAPVSDERFLRHGQIDLGVPIGIEAFADETGQKFIALHAHDFGTVRPCPLTYEVAESMVEQLHAEGCVPLSGIMRLMLTNLLVRSTKLFLKENLENLSLSPIYVRKNDYRIGAVKVFSGKNLRVHKRLAPDAHDRRAVFPYRPTARVS
ncbi:MAG TPA: hypothetical protein VGR69_02815 [Candidatus Rubrimentiphilum sp.]|nr:hypothetical protein [Candidatus Rubrimentiphilum sp.]